MKTYDPKENRITYLQELYLTSEQWFSELRLYSDELCFLQQLFERHYLDILQSESLDEMRDSIIQLQEMHDTCNALLRNVNLNQSILAKNINGSLETIAINLTAAHANLGRKVNIFVKNFKVIKKEIIAIAKHVVVVKKDAII